MTLGCRDTGPGGFSDTMESACDTRAVAPSARAAWVDGGSGTVSSRESEDQQIEIGVAREAHGVRGTVDGEMRRGGPAPPPAHPVARPRLRAARVPRTRRRPPPPARTGANRRQAAPLR